jgi:hypothetical protein
MPDPKPKILLIGGSPRAENNCPQQESKQSLIIKHILAAKEFADAEFDYVDLAVRDKIIQPCKACVSTTWPLCVYPCNCYEPNSEEFPDKMHDDKIYNRLENCHAFAVFTPIHWYGPSSQVKAMFDRLVCVNGGLAQPDLIDGKNVDKARALAADPEKEKELRVNHLGGKIAAFFIMGDNGADEGGEEGYPKNLTHKEIFDPSKEEHFNDPSHAIMPIVFQCRYSGIEVPEQFITGLHINEGQPYRVANELLFKQEEPWQKAFKMIRGLINYIKPKIEHIRCHISEVHEGHSHWEFEKRDAEPKGGPGAPGHPKSTNRD